MKLLEVYPIDIHVLQKCLSHSRETYPVEAVLPRPEVESGAHSALGHPVVTAEQHGIRQYPPSGSIDHLRTLHKLDS